MESSWKLELEYRVYIREHIDAGLSIAALFNQIDNIKSAVNEIDDESLRIKIAPEQIESARAKGYLVVQESSGIWVYVKVLRISIPCEDFVMADRYLADVISRCGNVFASVRIVQEYLTEVIAV